MDILLTFAGFHDPYSKGLIGDEEQAGPILSLIKAKAFDKVILLSTPNTLKNTFDTEKILKKIGIPRSVECRNLNLDDPTDYGNWSRKEGLLIAMLRRQCKILRHMQTATI